MTVYLGGVFCFAWVFFKLVSSAVVKVGMSLVLERRCRECPVQAGGEQSLLSRCWQEADLAVEGIMSGVLDIEWFSLAVAVLPSHSHLV